MLVEYRVIDRMRHVALMVSPTAWQSVCAPPDEYHRIAIRPQPREGRLEPGLPVPVSETVEQCHIDFEVVEWREVLWQGRVQGL